jgi:hypothetical protein
VAWRLVVAAGGARRWTGAVAGLVVGIIAHPLGWLFYAAYGAVRGRLPVDHPLDVVAAATVLSLPSIGLLGWISAPLGALFGYLVLSLKAARARRSE